jgi:hypothetical protein
VKAIDVIAVLYWKRSVGRDTREEHPEKVAWKALVLIRVL